MTNRTFGVEFEAHMPAGMTRGALATILRRATRLNVRVEGYGHSVPTQWKLVTDGSVGHGDGVEAVSPILSGEDGLEQARKIADAMSAAGCTISVKTGFHVHVYAGDLDLVQLRALAVNFVHAETAFDAIMPPSRRKDANQYIRSNRTAFGGAYENEAINKAIKAFNTATSINDLITKVSACHETSNARGTRYRKLNMTSMLRQQTVEFRQHAGTLEGEKAVNWVKLCVAMVERCLTARPRPRTSDKAHVATAELGMLLYWLRLDPVTCKYFRQRRKEFSDRNLRATEQAEAIRVAAIAATAAAEAAERARATEQRRVAAAARRERAEREANAERERATREAIDAAAARQVRQAMQG